MPRTPKNRALIIGIGIYPSASGITKLPAVSNDVREISNILSSSKGCFSNDTTKRLVNRNAKRKEILKELRWVFNASSGATVFVYFAGHGAVMGNQYYFIPYDADVNSIESSSIPLDEIRALFDHSPCQKTFLWLDFCHSGGMLARTSQYKKSNSEVEIVKRALKVVQGNGKVIIAACTEQQSSYEDSNHGVFTAALISGLRGGAMTNGEVTVSSLYDYIDRKIGSSRQRPMLFGKMAGRIVLMNYDDRNLISKLPKSQSEFKASTTKKKKSTQSSGSVISSSGRWTLLGDNLFFEASKVSKGADGSYVVEVKSNDSKLDADISSLTPNQFVFGNEINFAHRNDASSVRINAVTSDSTGRGCTWKIKLENVHKSRSPLITEMQYHQGDRIVTANEIAEKQIRAVLLNEYEAPRDLMGCDDVFFMSGLSRDQLGSPILEVYRQYYRRKTVWPKLARLKAIAVLKNAGIIEGSVARSRAAA